jgi:hypothetical protein
MIPTYSVIVHCQSLTDLKTDMISIKYRVAFYTSFQSLNFDVRKNIVSYSLYDNIRNITNNIVLKRLHQNATYIFVVHINDLTMRVGRCT